MAQKLSVQIELAGAAEIARQLENLGETGKQAFEEMGAAAEKVGGFSELDPAEVTQKLENMGITGVDAINQIQDAVEQAGNLEGVVQGVKNLEQGFGALGKVIRPLGGELRKIQQTAGTLYGVIGPIGVAGVAGFAAITAAVTTAAKVTIGFAESINKVNNEAIKLGAPVEKVDQFRAALERAGVSAESIGQILQSKLASEKGVAGLQAFINQLQQMPDGIGRSKLAVQEFSTAGAELIRIFQAGGKVGTFSTQGLISAEDAQKATQLEAALTRLKAAYGRLSSVSIAPQLTAGLDVATKGVEALGQRLEQAPWATFITGAQLAANPIQGLVNTIIQLGAALLQAKPEKLGQAVQIAGVQFTQFGTVAQQAGEQAGQATELARVRFTSYGTVVGEATTKTQTFSQSIASIAWDNISSTGVAAWNALTGAIAAAYDWLLKYIGLRPQNPLAGGAPTGQGGIGSNASGGLLGGRGTGTSDSNLAWVSRGEHIMPARAVAQPGVLAFLEALRRSGGDLSRVLGGMGRFALGGMVPRAIPAFASGGLAGGSSNVTIQFPGLPDITGLRASSGVVDELRKAAALAQVRSGGRKPSRYS